MAKREQKEHVSKSAKLQRWAQAIASTCYMSLLLAQPAAAADTVWTRFSTIMADVYGQLVGISTIVAVTAASVHLYNAAWRYCMRTDTHRCKISVV